MTRKQHRVRKTLLVVGEGDSEVAVKCAAVISQLSASGDGSFSCKRSVTQRWPLEARRSVALKQEIQSGRDLVLLLG